MFAKASALLHVASIAAAAMAADIPVIGIFTRENDIFGYSDLSDSYIGVVYTKWLESAGARSIAIHHNSTKEMIDEIFEQVNGVLFPGGAHADDRAGRYMYELAKAANEDGDRFPIMGMCMGHQWIMAFASGMEFEELIEWGFDAEDLNIPLDFTEYGVEESNMFKDRAFLQEVLQKEIPYNHHKRGLKPESFLAAPKLVDMFEITSTSVGGNGTTFVSSMEARDFETYPFWSLQWHPEKCPYEYAVREGTDEFTLNVVHTDESTRMALEMAEMYVEEARKSTHVYTKFKKYPIIWNHPIAKTEYFEQVFLTDATHPKNLMKSYQGYSLRSKSFNVASETTIA